MLNVYLKDGEGLSNTNMYILEQAAICLKALKGPWIAGGDWNLEPHLLVAANWLSMVGGVVHAPDQPTCHGHVYDFFVVRPSRLRWLEFGGWKTVVCFHTSLRDFLSKAMLSGTS